MAEGKSQTELGQDLFEQLHEAVSRGDFSRVKEAFLSQSEPKAKKRKLLKRKGDDGNDLLNLAAFHGHLAVVQFLVDEMGANIESRGAENRTPLIQACSNGGHVDVVRYLVKKGADLSAEDSERGGQAIHEAARHGDVATIDLLLAIKPQWLDKPGSKSGRTALMYAVANNNLAIAKRLLQKGADMELTDSQGTGVVDLAAYFAKPEILQYLLHQKPSRFDELDANGQNLFQNAATNGNVPVAKFLVEKGMDIDITDDDQCLAIHLAAHYAENVEIIDYLLQLRPQWLQVKDEKDGRTPLLHAAAEGNLLILKRLIELGADLDVRDSKSEALAINVAAETGNPMTIEYLLQLRPDWIEARDGKYGRTPFLSASATGNAATMKLLVEKGANIEAQDTQTLARAINLAAETESVEAVEYLLQLRPDWLEIRDDKWGRTAVIDAAAQGNPDVVRFLVDKGADVRVQDMDGNTAIHMAAEVCHLEVCKILLEKDPTLFEIKNKKGKAPLDGVRLPERADELRSYANRK